MLFRSLGPPWIRKPPAFRPRRRSGHCDRRSTHIHNSHHPGYPPVHLQGATPLSTWVESEELEQLHIYHLVFCDELDFYFGAPPCPPPGGPPPCPPGWKFGKFPKNPPKSPKIPKKSRIGRKSTQNADFFFEQINLVFRIMNSLAWAIMMVGKKNRFARIFFGTFFPRYKKF